MRDRAMTILPLRKANSALFRYRTQAWRWSVAFRDGPAVAIDRPVYLIGTQNGGLTLLARILHRHRDAISVTGDHTYWAGEDEAQDALPEILPEDFGWRRIDVPGFGTGGHSWLYGTDAFLPHYRRPAGSVDPAACARYRRILQGIIRQQGRGRPVRFVDKSQSLTLRVGAVQDALADSDPRFVLVTRDPHAVIWSQATRNGAVSALDLPLEEKVRLCAQHWANSYEAALADAAADPAIALRHWRFEDILTDPATTLRAICDFCDLGWDARILPGPGDRIPLGSRQDAFNTRKWYPLRADVNDRYLAALPDWARTMIDDRCGALARQFGYATAGTSRKVPCDVR